MAEEEWHSEYEGLQEEIRELEITPKLQVIENKYSDKDYVIELEMNEFTTICPKTKLPDFAELKIQYKPSKYLVEQKSLKLYLTAYRNIPIFQEHATNKVFEDFLNETKPKWAKITVIWHRRGGIRTKVEREFGVF
jgi:7-cyano-7-deazaguanine reductase